MASRTSPQSGLLSAGSTWVGGVAPVSGTDTWIVATGHTVTVDIDNIAGSNLSGVGHGVTINATDSVTFGKVIVNDAVTLTLRGFDRTNNTEMLINQWGQFCPAPGAIIKQDQGSDALSFINNKGIINALGTSGKHITWTVPAANAYAGTSAVSGRTAQEASNIKVGGNPVTTYTKQESSRRL